MKVRRVVTAHTADGKATVASDTMVEPITTALVPGMAFHRLWGADAAPVFPDEGSPRPGEQYLHAWHNRGAEPCVVVACLIGAEGKKV